MRSGELAPIPLYPVACCDDGTFGVSGVIQHSSNTSSSCCLLRRVAATLKLLGWQAPIPLHPVACCDCSSSTRSSMASRLQYLFILLPVATRRAAAELGLPEPRSNTSSSCCLVAPSTPGQRP